MTLDEYKTYLEDAWPPEDCAAEVINAYGLGYAQALKEMNEKARDVQTEPTWSQVRELIRLMDSCHYVVSKNDIVKAWVRDWTRHKIGLLVYKEVFDK